MKLQILVPHWKETYDEMSPLLHLIALHFERHPFTSINDVPAGSILWKSSHTIIKNCNKYCNCFCWLGNIRNKWYDNNVCQIFFCNSD